ncbi:hypothetical protein Glove_57g120 [Diversispora epigaea]|uniref:Uncharacterized protein n=1 Tax=Diversispora epigaea TaxID=1348612 RepID=A0A397JGN6_9GLOM|nr:hypothetical protein Glove_57g120 [Diversispora epigaea]
MASCIYFGTSAFENQCMCYVAIKSDKCHQLAFRRTDGTKHPGYIVHLKHLKTSTTILLDNSANLTWKADTYSGKHDLKSRHLTQAIKRMHSTSNSGLHETKTYN